MSQLVAYFERPAHNPPPAPPQAPAVPTSFAVSPGLPSNAIVNPIPTFLRPSTTAFAAANAARSTSAQRARQPRATVSTAPAQVASTSRKRSARAAYPSGTSPFNIAVQNPTVLVTLVFFPILIAKTKYFPDDGTHLDVSIILDNEDLGAAWDILQQHGLIIDVSLPATGPVWLDVERALSDALASLNLTLPATPYKRSRPANADAFQALSWMPFKVPQRPGSEGFVLAPPPSSSGPNFTVQFIRSLARNLVHPLIADQCLLFLGPKYGNTVDSQGHGCWGYRVLMDLRDISCFSVIDDDPCIPDVCPDVLSDDGREFLAPASPLSPALTAAQLVQASQRRHSPPALDQAETRASTRRRLDTTPAPPAIAGPSARSHRRPSRFLDLELPELEPIPSRYGPIPSRMRGDDMSDDMLLQHLNRLREPSPAFLDPVPPSHSPPPNPPVGSPPPTEEPGPVPNIPRRSAAEFDLSSVSEEGLLSWKRRTSTTVGPYLGPPIAIWGPSVPLIAAAMLNHWTEDAAQHPYHAPADFEEYDRAPFRAFVAGLEYQRMFKVGPAGNPSFGRGVEYSVYGEAANQMRLDSDFWLARGNDFVVPALSPPGTPPDRQRLIRMTAYGRLIGAMSYLFGAPTHVAPWVLLLLAGGREAMDLDPNVLEWMDPEMFQTLQPWAALKHDDPLPADWSDPVRQLLINHLLMSNLSPAQNRTEESHKDWSRSLTAAVLMGTPHWDCEEFNALRAGFNFEFRTGLNLLDTFGEVEVLSWVVGLYDRAVTDPQQVVDLISYNTTAGQIINVTDPFPSTKGIPLQAAYMFMYRLREYLCKPGHPDHQRLRRSGLIPAQDWARYANDHTLRARLFLQAITGGPSRPLGRTLQVLLQTSDAAFESAEDHAEPAPLSWHTCFSRVDVNIDWGLFELASDVDKGDDGGVSAFDAWLHSQIVGPMTTFYSGS